jgi:DNA helicase-2/ATP-dependent DNA helicase PcrA
VTEQTPAQLEAVTHPGGPLLIVAGAGAGKTHTLVERFAWLAEHGTAPDAILALTFSTAAADDLRERIETRLAGVAYEELTVTTFQAFCARLLREEALEAGVDPFAAPVTAADRLAMLLERIDELPLASHDLRGNPSALLGSIVQRIDGLKDELITAADYAAWAEKLPEDGEPARARAAREREFAAIYAAHDRMLAEAGTLDAGDLVLHAFRMLRTKPHIRQRLGARFRHVLVDEFQDTNFAQNLLLRLLVAEHGNVTAAGDDDQAIFRFRGASTKNFEDFRTEWPGAAVVRLRESFRSGKRILAAAHAVVAPDAGRIEKPLHARPGAPEGEVAFWRCANERAQAQAVAADVERLIARDERSGDGPAGDEGPGRGRVAPEDVCVLVRSVRGEGQAVAAALEERAVPYRLAGAAAFFQRAEVRDLIAWLRLLVDPGDAGAVVRALARPPVELRAIDLARCTQIARRRKLDMVAALGAAMESPQIPPEARERIAVFLRLYRGAAGQLDSTRPDLYVHRLIERLGLRRQLLFAASTEVVERLVNLAKFGELAADYLRRSPQSTAREFARSIAAVADAGLREEEAEATERPQGVQVMTMHAAKGREFDHVYVLGLMAARMPGPRQRALEPIPDALIKEALPPDSKAAHVAAMGRLLHVAMTRARRRLVLAYPAVTDRGAIQPPSPFAELARAALGAEWQPREEELFGPAETLQSTFRLLRDELLTTVQQVGGRLGELRFDTDLDVSHAVVRCSSSRR